MQAALGYKLKDLGYQTGLVAPPDFHAVKAPVFSFGKLLLVETSLGPEMKSTGEVMGVDKNFHMAMYKALVAAGWIIPRAGTILCTVADKDKEEAIPIIKGFAELGFEIIATKGTACSLQKAGLEVQTVNKISEGSPHIIDLIQEDKIHLVINTLTKGKMPEREGFQIRRASVEHSIPCLTSLDTTKVMLQVLETLEKGEATVVTPLQEYSKLGKDIKTWY